MSKIYVKESKIHGKGVYAKIAIKKGQIIAHIKGERKTKVNKTKEDAIANPDWVGFSKSQWTDPVPPFKFLNHSCEPNTGIKGKVTLIALRNISKDEEIVIDYSTTEVDQRWELKCDCKTKSCRKNVGSIHTLPKNTISKYLPHIPTNIRKLILNEQKR